MYSSLYETKIIISSHFYKQILILLQFIPQAFKFPNTFTKQPKLSSTITVLRSITQKRSVLKGLANFIMGEEVKLYGSWSSPFSRRVELALRMKGVEHKYFEEDLFNNKRPFASEIQPGSPKSPGFRSQWTSHRRVSRHSRIH